MIEEKIKSSNYCLFLLLMNIVIHKKIEQKFE